MKRVAVLALWVLCVLAGHITNAAVINLRLYHLGEADAAAVPLGPGDSTTIDSVASVNASKVGLTFYNGTGGGGPPAGLGLAPGSSMSMRFTNVDSRYVATAVSGMLDNFGIEAYVESSTTADARPFYNGGDGTPLDALNDGFGLTISGGQYVGTLGGVASIPTGVPVIPGKAVEFALVRNAGVYTAYIDRVAKASVAAGLVPVGAADNVSIGNFVGNFSPPSFAGVVDEARVFNFGPGGFDPSTDLGAAAIPEPASPALLGLCGLVIIARRRRALGPRSD